MDVDEKRSRLKLAAWHRGRFKGNYSNITCSKPTFSPVLPFHSPKSRVFTRHILIKLMKRESPLMSKDDVPRLRVPRRRAKLTFISFMEKPDLGESLG